MKTQWNIRWNIRWQPLTVLWLLGGIVGQAAGAGSPDFGFKADAGYRYDSNVNVSDIDANTGRSDTAFVTDLGVDASLPVGERLSLDLGYSYAGTRYRELSDFNLAIHRLHGELGYRFAGFDSALSVDRFAARLDDQAFLDITRVSPSLSRMFGDRLYLRGAWARSEKSYEARSERNAVNTAIRADAYFLIDGTRRYLALTLERDSEDASADPLDYDGISAKLAYGQRIEAGTLSLDLKAHVKRGNREYAAAPDAEEPPRRDERLRAGLSAVLPLTEHFELTGEAEYADNASTLAAASYDEIIYTLSIGARF